MGSERPGGRTVRSKAPSSVTDGRGRRWQPLLKALSRRAQAMVEMALVLPVLVVVVSGVIDFARVHNADATLHRVAKDAVNYGTQLKDGRYPTSPEIQSRVQAATLPPLDPAQVIIESIDVAAVDSDQQRSVKVALGYDLPLITPAISLIFKSSTFRVGVTAQMPFQQSSLTSSAISQPAANPTPTPTPTPVPSPPFTLVNNVLRTTSSTNVRIKILGKQLQCGAGGPAIPLRLRMATDPNGNTFSSVFSGNPVNGGEEMTITNLPNNRQLAFEAYISSCVNLSFRSNAQTRFSDNAQKYHQSVLKNGDLAPDKPGFSGQAGLSGYLAPFVNTTTRTMALGPRDAIYLFEFNSSYNSAAADFQDVVILVQFYSSSEPPPTTP